MLLIIVPATLICILIILSFYYSFRKKRMQRAQLIWLFSYLRIMRKLIQHVPQHRGMANAFLKGDASFKAKMVDMQQNINMDLQQLQEIVKQPSAVIGLDEMTMIVDSWASIERQVFSLLPVDSFNQHTVLITYFLNMMEDAAELTSIYSMSVKNGNHENELLLRAVIRDVPNLIETLGQARGLGTGIAAQAECSVANKIKLNFIRNNGIKVLRETIKTLLDSRNSIIASNKSSLERCLDTTNVFFDCLKTNFIEVNKIDILPTQYYEIATGAIDVSFNLLDELFDTLEKTVLERT